MYSKEQQKAYHELSISNKTFMFLGLIFTFIFYVGIIVGSLNLIWMFLTGDIIFGLL